MPDRREAPDPSRAQRHAAIAAACRAPSVHNTQPWRWRTRPGAVELHADRFRHLPATDPDRRDLLLSCGAALHHLRVAFAGAGVACAVDLLPDPEDRFHVATARPVAGDPDPALRRMALAIPHRRTDRRRMRRRPVPPELLTALAARAAAEGATLVPVVEPDRRAALLAALVEAAALQRTHPGYAAELQHWTHRPAGAHDGVPAANVPAPPIGSTAPPVHRRFGPTALPNAPARPTDHPDPGTRADIDPDAEDGAVFSVLLTPGDSTADRVRAGQATSAVLLTATGMGLSTTPFSQAAEVRTSRLRLRRDILGVPDEPQLLIRLGWPAPGNPPLPATPRRPLSAVLDDPGARGT